MSRILYERPARTPGGLTLKSEPTSQLRHRASEASREYRALLAELQRRGLNVPDEEPTEMFEHNFA